MSPPPRLVAYVRGDRLGDALLRLPVLPALRQAFPSHRITWLAGEHPSAYRTVLRPLVAGLLDEVLDQQDLGTRWTQLLWPPSLGAPVDILLDTQTRLLPSLILRRIPHRLFISPAAGFRLSDRRPSAPAEPSLTSRFAQLVELACGAPLSLENTLRLPTPLRELASERLPPGPCYVGLAPGAGGRRRCWPLERYIELARLQRERDRVPVFFLGPQERDWIAPLREALPGVLLPDLEGAGALQPGPLLSMALAERLAIAVANDAGAGHLLATAGCTVVSLYGHTDPAKFRAPGQRRIALRAADYGSTEVTAIPLAAVAEAVERALREPLAA